MKVILTGFGKFEGVSTNPTELIINHFIQNNSDIANNYYILKVAVDEVLEYCSNINYQERDSMIIHLGVHSSSDCMRFERYAYNNMTFRVQDESGYQPENQCINTNSSFDEPLQTDFLLDPIVEKMQSEGYNCCVSSDPGRYLCNYIYYQSLSRTIDCEVPKHVLFLHVPPLTVMSLEDQIKFVERAMLLLIEQVGTA